MFKAFITRCLCLILRATGSSQCYIPICRCREKPEGSSTTSSSPYRIQLQVFWMVKPRGSQRTRVVNPTRDPRQFWPENGRSSLLARMLRKAVAFQARRVIGSLKRWIQEARNFLKAWIQFGSLGSVREMYPLGQGPDYSPVSLS